MAIVPVYVAGNATIHAGLRVGSYPSGNARYRKLCSAGGRDNHHPSPVSDASTPITCKRCLAKLAAREAAPIVNQPDPILALAVRRLHSPPGSRIARTDGLPRHRPSRDGFESSPLTLRMLGDNVTLRRHQWAELLDSLDSASDLARRVRELLAR